ncbi:MAG: phosphoribosyltransferase family protein [Planctomycetota bacterium]
MFPEIERVLIDRDRIAERVRELGEEIARDIGADLAAEGVAKDSPGRVVMVPVLTGALIFVADLVRCMPLKLSFGVVAVSSYPGKSVASKGAALRSALPDDLAGRHVLVVDDILDSGQTMKLVAELIREQGAASVRTCALLRKAIPGKPPVFECDYKGFDIPDEFVVGYGLDYDGYYRNLPDITVLKGEAM